MAVILATSRETCVALSPLSYLADEWETYKAAVRGAVYDAASKTSLVPRHAWPTVVRQLHAAGFEVLFDARSAAWVREEGERARELAGKAEDRLDRLREKLASAGLALRPYQVEGVYWLSNRRAGLLLDEQGTGKTIQTICAIPEDAGVIICCPASLRGLWRDELAKWRPELASQTLVNDFHRWPTANEVFIMSESTVRQAVGLRPWPVMPANVYLVVDECQAFKGRSIRSAAMQMLAAAVREGNGWSIGLTGTPLMNGPTELFTLSLIFGVMRLAFGSWSQYFADWNAQKGKYNETIWGQPTQKVRENLKRVSLRRTRAEVMPELPRKVYQQIPVDIKARLRTQLDATEKALSLELAAWVTSDKLPAFEKHSEVWALLTKSKIDDMLDWCDRLEEVNEPALIFAMHLAPLERLRSRAGWAVITGSTKPEERTQIVKAFQNGDLKGVGLSILAGGTGLTLTRAAFLLFVDRSYNPKDNEQAEDRACRYGQHRSVQVSTLIADHPLDRRIYEIIQKKNSMIAEVV